VPYRLGQVLLDPGATHAFFFREGHPLQTRWVVTPKASALRFVKIEKAEFPFLEDFGILEREELTRPKLAMHSHTSKGWSAAPSEIPARASRWVRSRLAAVTWAKPFQDALVGWLAR
jgi:hypothetical protein